MEGLKLRTLQFTVPSGNTYEIREQNGEDDDIISNPVTSRDLSNLDEFISAIVVKTSATSKGTLTAAEASELPSLDRYVILLQSRIFSMGEILEFEYDWGKENGGVVTYEQDLREFLFDYSVVPSAEEFLKKPDAVPYYAGNEIKDIQITLNSGKVLLFDVLRGKDEKYVLNLPLQERTKSKAFIARNLRLMVDGKPEKVESFRLFSKRDMMEIDRKVSTYDPTFSGATTIINPNNESQVSTINIFGIPGFFFPGEPNLV